MVNYISNQRQLLYKEVLYGDTMATRKFNGKVYKEYTFTPTKANAEGICRGLRESGFSARSVKVKNGYTIYARK